MANTARPDIEVPKLTLWVKFKDWLLWRLGCALTTRKKRNGGREYTLETRVEG